MRRNRFEYFFERLILYKILFFRNKEKRDLQRSLNWFGLGCWVGNSSPSPGSIAFLKGRRPQRNWNTVRPQAWQQWRIFDNERLLDQAGLQKGLFFGKKAWKAFGCKPWFIELQAELPQWNSPANSVPAAAVRQRGKVFSIWTRPKARVGGLKSFELFFEGSKAFSKTFKLEFFLRAREPPKDR